MFRVVVVHGSGWSVPCVSIQLGPAPCRIGGPLSPEITRYHPIQLTLPQKKPEEPLTLSQRERGRPVKKMRVLPAVLLLFSPMVSSLAVYARPAKAPTARAHDIVAMAKKPVQKKKSSSSSLDFAGLGSTDTDGYRRGSLGIGENESKVIWAVVIGALVFGGGLDDETAQKIGAAQRSFYPQPPGYEEAAAARQAAKAAASPASVFPR